MKFLVNKNFKVKTKALSYKPTTFLTNSNTRLL